MREPPCVLLIILFWGITMFWQVWHTLRIFGSVDGERWKSEVYEEQRCLQRRLLQLHTVSGLCQCGKLRIHLIIASSISSVYSLLLYLSFTFLQTKLKHPSYQAMAKTSLQLAVQFLFHTYLRTKKKLRWDATFVYNAQTQG